MSVPRTTLIAVVVVVAAAALSGYCVNAKFRAWNERVEAVEVFAEQETARAAAEADTALVWRERADSIAAAAESVAPIIRDRIIRVREEAPPDPARDSLIDELVVEADQWRAAFKAERKAGLLLQGAYDRVLVVNDSLTTVLDARERPRSRWAPTFSVGLFAGICSNGQLCTGIGPGITFEIKIPTPW